MLTEFTKWFFGLVVDMFAAAFGLLKDVFIWALDGVLGGIVSLLGAIPVPEFLTQGMGTLFSQLDSGILWYVTQMGVPQGFAILGAAYAFRLVRKVVTLFQW